MIQFPNIGIFFNHLFRRCSGRLNSITSIINNNRVLDVDLSILDLLISLLECLFLLILKVYELFSYLKRICFRVFCRIFYVPFCQITWLELMDFPLLETSLLIRFQNFSIVILKVLGSILKLFSKI